jgi:Ca2+-binding RTX toxin-like protein
VLDGGPGGDDLRGGAGIDFASYENSAAGVTASLFLPFVNTGEASGDTYTSIQGLIGSSFDDVLAGDFSSNELRGGGGSDTLSGLFGNDRLEGGAGNDVLRGGWGNDTFAFNSRHFGSDTISDWQDSFFLNDVISFQGLGLSMADLSITYGGGDAIVSIIGTADEIIILDVARGSIGADDFLF